MCWCGFSEGRNFPVPQAPDGDRHSKGAAVAILSPVPGISGLYLDHQSTTESEDCHTGGTLARLLYSNTAM